MKNGNKEYTDCCVVGSGICGLTIANILADRGVGVKVLDKGRGAGGRIATRRYNHNAVEVKFDYGAQYFTVSEKEFRKSVNSWLDRGVVRIWSHGFCNDTGVMKTDDVPRYVGVGGMREISRHLSQNIDVRQSVKVSKMEWDGEMWELITEDGVNFNTSILVLTPPVPQSLDLLSASGINPGISIINKLEKVQYHPCLALLGVCKHDTSIPEPGGMWVTNSPVSWIADNKKKGVSTRITTVTIHSSPEFSREKWMEKDETIFEELMKTAGKFIGTEFVDYQIHRWRYSLVSEYFDDPFAYISNPGTLYIAGDAFFSPKIEGAFMSGHATANHILSCQV